MIVVGRRMLIEQTMKKKVQLVQRLERTKDEQYETTFKILQIGNDCPKDEGVVVGAVPIFDKNVTFNGAKVISETPKLTIIHTIVYYDDLIGIDD